MRYNSSNKPGVIRHSSKMRVNYSLFKEISKCDYKEWKTKPIFTWECRDTLLWLTQTLVKGGIDEECVNMEGFKLLGRTILSMTEPDFVRIDTNHGSYICERFNTYKQKNIAYSPEPTKGKENNPEKPKKRSPGRPRLPNPIEKPKKSSRIWEFIRDLLLNPETCPSVIKWVDYESRTFKLVQPKNVAALWGRRNSNEKKKTMDYPKFSRAMRYYYDKDIFESVPGRRMVYSFGKKVNGLETSNPNFVTKTNSEKLEDVNPINFIIHSNIKENEM